MTLDADPPCCSSRVMDPSCLLTTDEGESVGRDFMTSAGGAPFDWLGGVAKAEEEEEEEEEDDVEEAEEEEEEEDDEEEEEEVEEDEEEEEERACPAPGGSAISNNLCRRLHTKLTGRR